MIPNILIILGLALALLGTWLKVRGTVKPEPAPMEVAAKPAASNEEKGRQFEDWVVQRLSKQHHVLQEWRSDKKSANGTYAASTTHPDLEVILKLGGKEYPFAMECKWRNSFMGATVDLSDEQLIRYQRFGEEYHMPVFLVLGIGGQPSAPAELYAIPIRVLIEGKPSMERLGPYRQAMTRSSFYFDAFKGTLVY